MEGSKNLKNERKYDRGAWIPNTADNKIQFKKGGDKTKSRFGSQQYLSNYSIKKSG